MNVRLCVAVLLLMPSAAFAQGNPGPFGGLFGRTPERTGRDFTVFELRGSGVGQHDDAVFTDAPDGTLASGTNAGLSGSARFQRQSDRLQLQTHSTATYQSFFDQQTYGATSIDGGLQMNARVTTRLQVDAATRYLYSPFFQFHPTLFFSPSPAVTVPAARYAVTLLDNHTAEAQVGLSTQYSKSSALSGGVSRRQTWFPDSPQDDFAIDGVRGQWTRRLSRSFRFRAGYAREVADQGRTARKRYVHETIDLGVEMARQLSLSRRTSLNFNTESSMVREADGPRRFRLNGNVTLSRSFARTWFLSLGASRDTNFLAGFERPLFSDTVQSMLAGYVNSRTEFVLAVTGGQGQFGFTDNAERFTTVHGSTQLTVAMTRHLGVFAQYALYHYELPPGATSFDVRSRMSRQMITVGVNAWIPIFTRERETSRDSR